MKRTVITKIENCDGIKWTNGTEYGNGNVDIDCYHPKTPYAGVEKRRDYFVPLSPETVQELYRLGMSLEEIANRFGTPDKSPIVVR